MRIRVLVVPAVVVAGLFSVAPSLAATPLPVVPGVTDMGATQVDPAAADPAAIQVGLRSVAGLLRSRATVQGERLIEGLPFAFLATPYPIRTLTAGQLPFYGPAVIPKVDAGVHDEAGVRMRLQPDGLLYNHVTGQADYGLDNLNAYRITHDGLYLARAEAQAQRLIDRHVEANGAWFHPYDFTFEAMQPPWYSALAQGQALALFTRLYEVTADPRYKAAADGTFVSFLIKGPVDGPWVVEIDTSDHLWLEQYPGPQPDFTFNGHMFAALDLYDYYRVFHDERALELFRGAVTTAADYAAAFRQPGRRSLYCLAHKTTASAVYHEAHVQEFLKIFTITGDARFARLADNFENDYPRDTVNSYITVAPGKVTALRFASTGGTVVERKVVVAAKAMHVHVSVRRRVPDLPGFWFRGFGGAMNGWWLAEWAPRVYFPGILVRLDYAPARSLTIPASLRRAPRFVRRFAANGTVLAALQLPEMPRATTVQVSARAIVDGRARLLMSSGPWAGYWIDLAGVTLL